MEETAAKSRRGRPADPEKSDQILQIATELFLSNGFSATSMEEIAKAAHMSKLTLYRRFPDKDALFAAVIGRKCAQHVPDDLFGAFDDKAPREAIYVFGKALLSLVTSDDAIRMYRMLATHAEEHPELSEIFYYAGPTHVRAILAEKLEILRLSGALRVNDTLLARDMLVAMFTGSDIHMRTFLNIGPKPSAKEIDDYVLKVTDCFLNMYDTTMA
jgi:TetR/AcrR family transcriptional repressor of mexJK operon